MTGQITAKRDAVVWQVSDGALAISCGLAATGAGAVVVKRADLLPAEH